MHNTVLHDTHSNVAGDIPSSTYYNPITPYSRPATRTTRTEVMEYDAKGNLIKRTVTTTTTENDDNGSMWWQPQPLWQGPTCGAS